MLCDQKIIFKRSNIDSRLNNQLQDVRNVMPTYAPRIPPPVVPAYNFQSTMMPSQMQLVPYNPTQVAQLYPQLQPPSSQETKKPLTSEELQRLYSLNNAVVPRPNVVPGYVPATAAMSSYGGGCGYYGTNPYSMYSGASPAPSYQSIYPSNISTGAAPKVSSSLFPW